MSLGHTSVGYTGEGIGDLYTPALIFNGDGNGRDVFLTNMSRSSARSLAHAMRKSGLDAVMRRRPGEGQDDGYEIRLPIPVTDVRYVIFCELVSVPMPTGYRAYAPARPTTPARAWRRKLLRVGRLLRNEQALATLDTAWRMNAPVKSFRSLMLALADGRQDDG